MHKAKVPCRVASGVPDFDEGSRGRSHDDDDRAGG